MPPPSSPSSVNLLQPVNPWLGNQWLIYNEYYQWSPSYNFVSTGSPFSPPASTHPRCPFRHPLQNSDQQEVKAGDNLYGSITFNPANESYTIYHNVSGSVTWEVSSNIPVQKKGGKAKTYSIAYVVYEKVAPCGDYPPDGKVTFTGMTIECDNKPFVPTWSTAFVEDVCNNRAKVIDPSTIEISWNTKAADPSPEKIAASQALRTLGGRRF